KMQKRERGWLIGLSSVWACLGIVLLIMLNPNTDRQTQDLIKVFFTSSYVLLALLMGYGVTLCLAALVMQYQRYRFAALCACAAAILVGIIGLLDAFTNSQYLIMRAVAVFGFGLAVLAGGLLLIYRQKAPLAGLLVLVALMPIYPI